MIGYRGISEGGQKPRGEMVLSGGNAVVTNWFPSTDVVEVAAFLKGNSTLGGLSLQYGITADGRVFEVVSGGKLTAQKRLRPFIEMGIVEWHYSWAFASDNWRLADGRMVAAVSVDDMTVGEFVYAARGAGLLV